MIRRVVRAAALAAAALGVGACGGGEELSVDEFAGETAEICRQSDAEALDAQPEGRRPRTFDEAQAQLELLGSIARDELERVEELNEPAELAEAVDAYLAERRRAIELMAEGVEALGEGDFPAYRRVQRELNRGQAERRRLARAAGMHACSRPIPDYEV